MRTRPALALVLSLTLTAMASPQGPDQAPAAPSARSGYALAYDSARHRLVLFGGSAAADAAVGRLGDTWEWDGSRWSTVDGAAPTPRFDAAATYDAARGQVVLFGGSTDDGRSSETWLLGAAGWRLAATEGPPPRTLSAMAWDAGRERVVLFGGSGDDRTRLGDTWEWDGSRWHEMEPEGETPSGRGAHAMAGHRGRGTVMLYGGWDGEATATDLWEWDGVRWSRLDDGPPRLHTALGYDPMQDRLVTFGGFGAEGREGTTWTWSPGGWEQVSADGEGPPARAEHEGIWVEGRGLAIFGGIVGQGMAVEEREKDATLWLWDGTAWSAWPGRP